MFGLSGRTAVVTGGANGIGAGISAVLAEAGANVVIADRDEASAQREAAALRDAGYAADAVTIDLADEASVVRGCADILAKHGAPWALINNAGVQDREALLQGTTQHWDRTYAINARGPFLTTREIGRAMAASGAGGRIVNIASVSVKHPVIYGLAAYASSKGALITLTQSSAFELAAHGITVNAVLPHGVFTPGASGARGPAPEGPGKRLPPLGWGEPRDLGAAVLFFVSSEARLVTNQVLAVDGAFLLS